jgi:hypothetical protein
LRGKYRRSDQREQMKEEQAEQLSATRSMEKIEIRKSIQYKEKRADARRKN